MASKEYKVQWIGDYYGWCVVAPDTRIVKYVGTKGSDKQKAETYAARLNKVLKSQGGYNV